MYRNRFAIFICILFVCLGSIYINATPIFEASDERWHYPVVKFIVDTGQLPYQDVHAKTAWHQEGSQPPLYYILSAMLTFWIDTTDFVKTQQINPHAIVGQPLVIGNKNMMLPLSKQGFEQGTMLAVYIIRFFSLGLGTMTVWLTWRIATELCVDDKITPLLAMTLTAFNPMFLFISASVNNDNLVAPLSAMVILLLLRVLKHNYNTHTIIWLGLFLGLGALTKLSALGLIPLVAIVLSWQSYRHGTWRLWLQSGMLSGGLLIAVAGWWYWQNWIFYGDPTGLNRMLDIAGRRMETVNLLAEFEGFRISYWGLFGAVNIIAESWIYHLLDGLVLIGTLGFLIRLWQIRNRVYDNNLVSSYLLISSWVAIVFFSLIRWTLMTYASQGRLMFVAIAGISSLVAIGLMTLTRLILEIKFFSSLPNIKGFQNLSCFIISTSLFTFALISPLRYIIPAYTPPSLIHSQDLPHDMIKLNWTYSGKMKLLGYRLSTQTIKATEHLPLELYWQALKPMQTNYSIFIHLYGRERQTIGNLDTYPGLGLLPTTTLAPHDIFADTYFITVHTYAEKTAPSRLKIGVGLYNYHEAGLPRLQVTDEDGHALNDTIITEIKLVAWNNTTQTPQHPLAIQFGDNISLIGFDSTCTQLSTPCSIIFYWQPSAAPTADYHVFIQLWHDKTQIHGFDGPVVNGDYPTSLWQAGEIIIDEHQIIMPDNLLDEDYQWQIGLYRLDTGERLYAAHEEGGMLPNFAVTLP